MIRIMEGVLLIAAYTARSQAYVQTLLENGLVPAHTLLLGNPSVSVRNARAQRQRLFDILLPDLNIPLQESLATADARPTHLNTRDINAPEVIQAVRQMAPQLIIFSGYGGQIVKAELIDLGIPLLHIHSGWLPEYRGSTTVYYSLLEEQRCAASAILLDKQIDTGPVLARKHYPAPPRGTDIDTGYDPAIRADLLLEVLQNFLRSGQLQIESQQSMNEGNSYYVIHPLLKHLALLSLPKDS